MNIEEAIKILDYKINMYKEDVFIGDLDKTNIEAIKKVLEEIDRLNNIISKAIEYIEQQYKYEETAKEDYDILLDILKGVDKE